jgi:hypothetical protein
MITMKKRKKIMRIDEKIVAEGKGNTTRNI